jgi:hypothetical protein
MRISFPIRLLLPLFALLSVSGASAQTPYHLLHNPEDSLRAQKLVEGFFRNTVGRKIPADTIDHYAADLFATHLRKADTAPLWNAGTDYRVVHVWGVGDNDPGAIATAVTHVDSIPWFGRLDVDWVFYLRSNEGGEWRISELRRMSGTNGIFETLGYLDTTSYFPAVLKQEIAREVSTMLLSNDQLREHFQLHQQEFQSLLAQFQRKDSLKMLARVDRKVVQLNAHTIDWGIAAEETPQPVIDEFLKRATPAERKELEARLRLADKIRRQGMDTVKRLAKKMGLSVGRLDSTIALMKDLRVAFVNKVLPWHDAVQITLAGKLGDALGYIYSPHGELPLINPNEYFYLEDLGNGWWIFRST